jgi:hypothetical protein
MTHQVLGAATQGAELRDVQSIRHPERHDP